MLSFDHFCRLVKVERGPFVRLSYPVYREVPGNYYGELVQAYGDERAKRMVAARMYRDYAESVGVFELIEAVARATARPCDSASELRDELCHVMGDFSQRFKGEPYA